MADKNIQIQNTSGDNLYPRTKAEAVQTADGSLVESLGKKLEKIKVNGVELTIETDKSVDIELPAYSVVKAPTADEGFAATYQLTRDGVATGTKINIPKDMVVQSGSVKTGSVKTVTTADAPVTGYKVGDKYIDLVLANAANSHIYILVTDLIATYETMTGATESAAGTEGLVPAPEAGAQAKFLRGDGSWQTPPTTTFTAGNGITITGTTIAADISLLVTTTALATALETKADKATTLAGYGITDALAFVDVASF